MIAPDIRRREMCACTVAVDFVAAAYFFGRALLTFPRRRAAMLRTSGTCHGFLTMHQASSAWCWRLCLMLAPPQAGISLGAIPSVRIVPQSHFW